MAGSGRFDRALRLCGRVCVGFRVEWPLMTITEKQRLDAIACCDRIQEACAQQQTAFENIVRIFDNMANGRDPKDGLIPIHTIPDSDP